MQELNLSSLGKIPEIVTSISDHAALTTAHGAVSAATASRLVIRDAAGRARFADPSDDADAATKGWVASQISGMGTVTSVSAGTGLSGGPITTTGSLSLASSGATPGSYTNPNVTVDAYGRITTISSGSAPVLSVSASTNGLSSTGGQNPTISISAATGSVAGAMSAADKAKLDGIASGAQVNTITAVFGRTGAVTATTGDYTIQKISGVTVSASAPSGGSDGDIWFKV